MADPVEKTEPKTDSNTVAGALDKYSNEPKAARVDIAHPVRLVGSNSSSPKPSQVDEDLAASPAPEAEIHALPLATGNPLTSQAADLAEQLANQQAELDRRSEAVAAQEADLENKLRTARMWFDQQHDALDEKNEALEKREASLDRPTEANCAEQNSAADEAQSLAGQDLAERQQLLDARQAELYEQVEQLTNDRAKLAERESRIDARQKETEQKAEQLSAQQVESRKAIHKAKADAAEVELQSAKQRELQEDIENQLADLSVRETQLAARHAEVSAAIKRFESLGVTEQKIAELTEQAQQFAARSRYLDEAEQLLSEEQSALAEERRQLQSERQKTQEDMVAERRRIEAERADAKQLAAHNQQQADARQTQLDQRQASLEQLQSELEVGQREVLEMRLATEETWAQLAGALAPATLTRSIAQVRSRLADQYQHTLQQLADRRQELENVSSELAAEHGRLDEQRSRLQLWAGRREADIEQRAARLVGREHELDRQQRHYEQLETRWALERDEYREQIRNLLSESRKYSLRAAA